MTKTLRYGDTFAAVYPQDAEAPGPKQAALFAVIRNRPTDVPQLVMVRDLMRVDTLNYHLPVIEQGESFIAEGTAFMVREEETFLSIDRIHADASFVSPAFREQR